MDDKKPENISEAEIEKQKIENAEQEQLQDKEIAEAKEKVKKDAKYLFSSVSDFLHDILDLKGASDRDQCIEAIKADIPFKGATAWILICSIFVASVGLNANSTAVVIGAMLISPLMGPILGVGFSIAVNDIDTLKRSLVNFAVMIVLSILTAYLFFFLFPLSEDTSELLGRVRPDIRDVLIAFFGGLALIIAKTKRGTIASVIFGVAIATALMPPLCTAGYGMAIANWEYFWGAMYLFLINSIFIALATFLVLKLLRFPMQRYVNSKKRRRISRFVMLTAILVMIPAVLTFLEVLDENRFERDYNNFIKNEITANDELWLQRPVPDLENKVIRLYFNGEISEATVQDLNNELKDYPNLVDFRLDIKSNSNRSTERILEAYDRTLVDLEEREYTITGLRNEVEVLQKNIESLNDQLENKSNGNNNYIFSTLARDTKIRFADLEYLAIAQRLESSDFIKVDTTNVVTVRWKNQVPDSTKNKNEVELKDYLSKAINKSNLIIERNN